jgi:hypothetical protein
LKGLIGRFPDREEYVITRSEFDLVKKRLSGGNKSDEQPEEELTLKRQDGDSRP